MLLGSSNNKLVTKMDICEVFYVLIKI